MNHSARPKTLRVVAVGAVLALVAAVCGGGGSSSKKSTTSTAKANNASTAGGKVTVNPLAVTETADGSVGSTHPVTVRLSTSNDKKFRVGFTEDEVGGTGDQWRAAGWSATSVATLLTGAPLTEPRSHLRRVGTDRRSQRGRADHRRRARLDAGRQAHRATSP